MSVALLKKFFDLAKPEDKKCGICLDHINSYDEAYITFNCCAYIFHSQCIRSSINLVNTKCPICNKELVFNHENGTNGTSEVTDTPNATENNTISDENSYDDDDSVYSDYQEQYNNNFLRNFTRTHISNCDCPRCTSYNFYFRLKFAIVDDKLNNFIEILSFLDIDLMNYDCEYTDRMFLFAIKNNSYEIIQYFIDSNFIDEYPDTEDAMEIFQVLAENKNYKMLRYLAEWSLETLPTLVGYTDPELNCILGYNQI
jgi:hypothetical protein